MKDHKHRAALVASTGIVVAAVVALSGCTGTSTASGGSSNLSGTVSLWDTFTGKNDIAMKSMVAGFEKANPKIHVNILPGQDDDKLVQTISTGSSVDVAISQSPDNVGVFCSTGAFRDLTPYLKRDNVDRSQFSNAELQYTSYKGDQCTLPMLTDYWGLYINTSIADSAGITTPPKTLSELEADALKMTTYNPDGSIKQLGFNPLIGWGENAPNVWSVATGAKWTNSKGESDLATQPAWTELMNWQKSFVDKIGYEKLKTFTAGLGQEFSGSNAFYTGQVAMMLDGDWRVAHFIQDGKTALQYSTAPIPVAEDHTDLYGSGTAGGNTLGIAKSSKNPDLAWALLKYLTTDTKALTGLNNALGNTPSTKGSLSSPLNHLPKQSGTFLAVAKNPHSYALPPTVIGAARVTNIMNYWEQWQAGKGGDLKAGLAKVDSDTNNAIKLSEGQ